MITYTLKIVAIINETVNTKTICFKQPSLKKIRYKPGQYVTLIININGRKYRRPYSISSAPDVDTTLNITIKRIPGGIVSNYLLDKLQEGDILEVIEPIGSFVFDSNKHYEREIFLWGAGSGVTPLMSILKCVLVNNCNKVNLLYCNKSIEQTIFYKQLIMLHKQYPDRLKFTLFCTEEVAGNVKRGRIEAYHVTDALSVKDKVNTLHYICGPIGLKDTIKSALYSMNLTDEQIFSEDFENVVDQAQLKDVQTRFVKLIRVGQAEIIEVIKGKSILEACLDSGLDMPYSCQTGSCTLCKAKLLSGDVKTISREKMDKNIGDNERLLCCSYPLTENIIFEIS